MLENPWTQVDSPPPASAPGLRRVCLLSPTSDPGHRGIAEAPLELVLLGYPSHRCRVSRSLPPFPEVPPVSLFLAASARFLLRINQKATPFLHPRQTGSSGE